MHSRAHSVSSLQGRVDVQFTRVLASLPTQLEQSLRPDDPPRLSPHGRGEARDPRTVQAASSDATSCSRSPTTYGYTVRHRVPEWESTGGDPKTTPRIRRSDDPFLSYVSIMGITVGPKGVRCATVPFQQKNSELPGGNIITVGVKHQPACPQSQLDGWRENQCQRATSYSAGKGWLQVQVEFPYVLLRTWCPWRLQPEVIVIFVSSTDNLNTDTLDHRFFTMRSLETPVTDNEIEFAAKESWNGMKVDNIKLQVDRFVFSESPRGARQKEIVRDVTEKRSIRVSRIKKPTEFTTILSRPSCSVTLTSSRDWRKCRVVCGTTCAKGFLRA